RRSDDPHLRQRHDRRHRGTRRGARALSRRAVVQGCLRQLYPPYPRHDRRRDQDQGAGLSVRHPRPLRPDADAPRGERAAALGDWRAGYRRAGGRNRTADQGADRRRPADHPRRLSQGRTWYDRIRDRARRIARVDPLHPGLFPIADRLCQGRTARVRIWRRRNNPPRNEGMTPAGRSPAPSANGRSASPLPVLPLILMMPPMPQHQDDHQASKKTGLRGGHIGVVALIALTLASCGLFGERGPVKIAAIGPLNTAASPLSGELSSANAALLDATSQGLVSYDG